VIGYPLDVVRARERRYRYRTTASAIRAKREFIGWTGPFAYEPVSLAFGATAEVEERADYLNHVSHEMVQP
jgi:hypothetical protein